jgi:hypothetical protein
VNVVKASKEDKKVKIRDFPVLFFYFLNFHSNLKMMVMMMMLCLCNSFVCGFGAAFWNVVAVMGKMIAVAYTK